LPEAFHVLEKREEVCSSGSFWGGCIGAAPCLYLPCFSYKYRGEHETNGGEQKREGREEKRKKRKEKGKAERRRKKKQRRE
jgi:hypothetical protein